MDKFTKRLLLGATILIVFSFALCYKIRSNSEERMKADFQAVKAQNQALKADICKIKDLLEQQARHRSYSWSASNKQH